MSRTIRAPRLAWLVFFLAAAGCSESTTPEDNPCHGLVDGTPCGDATANECNQADTCVAEVCVPNFRAPGFDCGDPTIGQCNLADYCDGAGTCRTNFVTAGQTCGDSTESECDHADTCDGAGACGDNLAAATSACGDASESECDHADSCDGAGACQTNVPAAATACGSTDDTECDDPDSCDGAGACLPNYIVASTSCGDAGSGECDGSDTCDGAGACLTNHVAAGAACGDATDSDCDGADTCDGDGACGVNHVADGTYCYDCPTGAGHCDVCTSLDCNDGAGCTLPTSTSLMASNTAGNNHRGNMFDITATNTVTITSFDASPMGNTTIEIYYKVGTWNGFANTPSAWTFVGSAPVAYTGGFAAVPVPVNVTIPAGQTYAFYVTSNTSAVSLNYSNGTAVGNVYSGDANITFMEGGGMEYPFTQGTGAVYQPRVWNGNIHYVLPGPTLATTTPAYAGSAVDGAMFAIESITDVSLPNVVMLELEAGTYDVDVYFRRGDYVGHESSPGGWEQLAHVVSVTSAGGGALSPVRLSSSIDVLTGESVSFYVATSGDGLRVDPAANPGDSVATTAALIWRSGNSVDTSFAGIGPASVVRGQLQAFDCQ